MMKNDNIFNMNALVKLFRFVFLTVGLTVGLLLANTSVNAQSFISGLVFQDTNADGLQATTEGVLSGVSLEIYPDDGAGNIGGPAFATQTTFFDGSYKFDNLVDGLYCVQIDDATQTPTNPVGSLGTICGLQISFLTGLSNVKNVDFGLFNGFKITMG